MILYIIIIATCHSKWLGVAGVDGVGGGTEWGGGLDFELGGQV